MSTTEHPPSEPSPEPAAAIIGDQSSSVAAVGRSAEWTWVLHVYALIAIAIAGPMFARLQERTPFLISLMSVTVILFVTLWSVVIPGAVLMTVSVLRRRSPRAGAVAVQWLVGFTCCLILLETLGHRLSGGGWGVLTLAGAIAGGFFGARLYERWAPLRSMLTIAAFGSLLFPASLLTVYFRDSHRPAIKETLTAGNPVPVVMVVFDCFCGVSLMGENRLIDKHRYPHFAELATTSNWYRNCTSVHPRTNRAVPAILTGGLRRDVSAATVKEYPQNLFTLLNATGKYQLTAFEPFTSLCPQDRLRDRIPPNSWSQWLHVTRVVWAVFLHDLVPPDLPFETPKVHRGWFGLDHVMGANREQRQGVITYGWDVLRNDQFEHFLDCLRPTDQPNLWFGHFALPHFPWNYLPSGHLYRPDLGIKQVWGTEGPLFEQWADDEQTAVQAHQQYLLQLGYTDWLIGRLIDRLRDNGLFDRCLLVVMADHGVSFRQGLSERLPTEKNLADIMSVPLFIKLPGQNSGDVVDLNVETTDVLPTILDVLKLVPPTSPQGQSLIDSQFAERPVKRFTDDVRTFEVDASFNGKYNVLSEQLAKFGTGDDPLRIFRIGPHPELVGRRLDDLQIAGKSTVQILPVNFTESVEYTEGRVVPAHLHAQVAPPPQAGEPLEFAIAVNDIVWGTAKTYRVNYLRDFWRVMLPEAAFSPGPNQVRVFQISKSPTELTLLECSFGPRSSGPVLSTE